jgi:hypothetical protein
MIEMHPAALPVKGEITSRMHPATSDITKGNRLREQLKWQDWESSAGFAMLSYPI